MDYSQIYAQTKEENSNVLADGEYYTQITKVTPKVSAKNTEYFEIELRIKDHADANPSKFCLFGFEEVDKQTSTGKSINGIRKGLFKTFFKAFNIPEGNFQINAWLGHYGFVKCRQQKNSDYKELVPFSRKSDKNNTTQNTQPQTAPIPQAQPLPQPVQNVVNAMPVQQVTMNGQSFPDEIPF